MTRRSFLNVFSVATVAIATCTLRAADMVRPIERPPAMLLFPWFQSPRAKVDYSPEYLAALDRVFSGQDPQKFISAFSR